MRLFVALACPREQRGRLAVARDSLKSLGNIKIVADDNLHITLKFLGDVDSSMLGRINAALSSLNYGRFELALKGLGAFPSPNRAKVVWAGVSEGFDEVVSLSHRIDESILELGFGREIRFHPHVTLARVKGEYDKNILKDVVEASCLIEYGKWQAQEFILMESRLSSMGPAYVELETFPLS
jgi:2'-5' RNA ligase